jgi:putative glutamine amidotransferase
MMEGGMFPGIKRAYVNHEYIEAVEMVGEVPVIIPVGNDFEGIERQIENINGIIILVSKRLRTDK